MKPPLDHLPIVLTGNERADLGSVQRHPGFVLFVEKVLKGHAQQQIHKIFEVELSDADRVTKLDAICAVAHAMQGTLELARWELDRNIMEIEAVEEKTRREAGL